jgi:uncharacterized protein YcsI (UPF0317 family)
MQEGFEGWKEPRGARGAIRGGRHAGTTAGLAPGYVQANLVILPAALAADFARYCDANPKPCPVLARSRPGEPMLPALGTDIDVRTDLPRYRVWRYGAVVAEPDDVLAEWRDDLVAFALGCSFSFEQLLIEQGMPLRHVQRGTNVPMYRTSLETAPAGVFSGPLVVSMRPLRSSDAIRAIEITSRYPEVHGAPVHIGAPQEIGILDIAAPDYGDPVEILPGELPVFWACGVTPQAAIERAKPPFCITHAPGCMLISDLKTVPNERKQI